MAWANMEEEPPPPAFQMDAQPMEVGLHVPTENSMQSVQAEVLAEPKGNKPFSAYNQQHNMMNMNGAQRGMPMMPQNMMMAQNMNPNMMPPPVPKNANRPPAGGVAGPFPILSEEFMNKMLNMAANLDVQDMNANMQQAISSNQRNSNLKNNGAAKPKGKGKGKGKGADLARMQSSPNVGFNNRFRKKEKKHSGVQALVGAYNSYAKPLPPHAYAQPQAPAKPKPKPLPPRPPPPPNAGAQAHRPPLQQANPEPPPSQELDNPIQGELVSMGFEKEYVIRACNLYKKKFKNKPMRLEVLTEIIIRLQQRDQSRRQRSKSIDSVAGAGVAIAAPDPQMNGDMNNGNQRRRSSIQGVNAYSQAVNIPQSESYEYIQNNNDYHNNYAMGIHHDQNMKQMEKQKSINASAESIAISIIMSASSIGPQNCDIIIRKDQTLQDAKQLISTCLTDFDQFDQSYAFFDDNSGYIFDAMDMTILQVLQLMDIEVEKDNIVLTLKIGRILSKYIKLK
eukprot:194438_1